MTEFLHMHHAMANKALMIESTRKDADPWQRDTVVLRQIVLSGQADYTSRHENITVTDADRKLVLEYLGV